jgi:hypothetical protein
MTLLRTLGFVALTVAGVSFLACSSEEDGSNKSDSEINRGGDPKRTPDAGAAEAGPSSRLPSAATCKGKTTASECAACCLGAKRDHVSVGWRAADACLCKTATAKCAAECAEPYCATADAGVHEQSGTSSDDACNDCLAEKDWEACDDVAAKACADDALCAAAEKCFDGAGCASKPDPDAQENETPTEEESTE